MGYDLVDRTDFKEAVRAIAGQEFGGMINFHVHGDRAYTRHQGYYSYDGMEVPVLNADAFSLKEKQKLTWVLHKGPGFKKECIEERVRKLFDSSLNQGVRQIWTTSDVTHNVGLKSFEVLDNLKKEYSSEGLDVRIGVYNPSGFKDSAPERFELFEAAAEKGDFLVALAEKDENNGHIGAHQHNLYMLGLAYDLKQKRNKDIPIQFHVGQANTPEDNSVDILLEDIDWKLKRDLRVLGNKEAPSIQIVHAISPFCRDEDYISHFISKLRDVGASLVCCPKAALSMRQEREYMVPTHNSIADIWRVALESDGKVPIFFGTDNVGDIYIPSGNTDVADEAEEVATSLRINKERLLAKICAGKSFDDFDLGELRRIIH